MRTVVALRRVDIRTKLRISSAGIQLFKGSLRLRQRLRLLQAFGHCTSKSVSQMNLIRTTVVGMENGSIPLDLRGIKAGEMLAAMVWTRDKSPCDCWHAGNAALQDLLAGDIVLELGNEHRALTCPDRGTGTVFHLIASSRAHRLRFERTYTSYQCGPQVRVKCGRAPVANFSPNMEIVWMAARRREDFETLLSPDSIRTRNLRTGEHSTCRAMLRASPTSIQRFSTRHNRILSTDQSRATNGREALHADRREQSQYRRN